MIHFVLWKWSQPGVDRDAYTAEHVNIMARMLMRNMVGHKYRVICITDDVAGISECKTHPLWDDCFDKPNASGAHLPSCYRRLKLYDPATQEAMGIKRGERIMSIDLDALITGHLREVVQTQGRFVGWELKGTYHPRVYNGSLQMFTAGDLADVWRKFDPHTSPMEANRAGYKGSDQAWLSMLLVNRKDTVGLKWPLIASYPLNVRLQALHDARTRIVFYHGLTKPWSPAALRETRLTQQYWRA